MTIKLVGRCILPVSLLATTTAVLGQEVLLEAAPQIPRNRFSAAFRMGFNMDVKFKNIGGFGALSNPEPHENDAVDGPNWIRTYDDGFVAEDVTGNNHGPGFENTTWYWGYQNDSQYDSSGSGSITMHSASSSGALSRGQSDEPHPGFEMVYGREIFRDEYLSWGWETAFNYMDVEVDDNSPLNAAITIINDTYALNGVVPPTAPYAGTFDGFGPVMSDTPSRTFTTGNAAVAGRRQFGADLFGFRFGPWVEIPVAEGWTLSFNGGGAVVYVHSHFRFNETVTTESGPVSVFGSSNDSDVLFGGYIGGNLSVALNDSWTGFVGVEWQNVGDYSHRPAGGSQQAELSLSSAVFLNIGVSVTF